MEVGVAEYKLTLSKLAKIRVLEPNATLKLTLNAFQIKVSMDYLILVNLIGLIHVLFCKLQILLKYHHGWSQLTFKRGKGNL